MNIPIQNRVVVLRAHGPHHRTQAQSLFKWIFPLCPLPRTKVQCLDSIEEFISVGYKKLMQQSMVHCTWGLGPKWKIFTAYNCEYLVHFHNSPATIPLLDKGNSCNCTLPILTHGEDVVSGSCWSVYGPLHGKCQTLPEILDVQNGTLTSAQSIAIVDLYKCLDDVGILLQDHRPTQIVYLREKWFFTTFTHARQCKTSCSSNNRDSLRWMLYDPLQGIRSQLSQVPQVFFTYYGRVEST